MRVGLRSLSELRVASSGPAVTAEHVRNVILRDIDCRMGKSGSWQVEGPLVTGRGSQIFRARTPLADWPLAVKVYGSQTPASKIAQHAALLKHYHEHMADRPGLGVPALWAALPEHRTVITEWIAEPRVDDLLRRAGSRRQDRTAIIAAAGRWLRHFHDHSAPTIKPLKSQWLQRQIDRMFGDEAGARARSADPAFRKAYDVLVRLTGEFTGASVSFVKAHGDFVPHNLFHGPSRTVGLDLSARLKAPVTRDIWTFMIDAEASRPFLVRRSALGPLGTDRQDFDAFMTAYGRPDNALQGQAFAYLQLLEVLRRWALLISLDRRSGMSLARRIRIFRLRRMASCAVAALDGSSR